MNWLLFAQIKHDSYKIMMNIHSAIKSWLGQIWIVDNWSFTVDKALGWIKSAFWHPARYTCSIKTKFVSVITLVLQMSPDSTDWLQKKMFLSLDRCCWCRRCSDYQNNLSLGDVHCQSGWLLRGQTFLSWDLEMRKPCRILNHG